MSTEGQNVFLLLLFETKHYSTEYLAWIVTHNFNKKKTASLIFLLNFPKASEMLTYTAGVNRKVLTGDFMRASEFMNSAVLMQE